MSRRWARLAAASVIAGALATAIALLASGGGPHRPPSTKSLAPTTASRTIPTTPTARPPVNPPAQPPPATEQFGANVNSLLSDPGFAPQLVDAQLAALRASGATVARSDAFWETAEPHPPVGGVHTYDWSFDDRVAGLLARHGLAWLPIIDYTTSWAQSIPGRDHSPPTSSADYAAYAGALAARYGGGGSFWRGHPNLPAEPVGTYEIWNEPDNAAFWSPTPDASRYDDLYIEAREAITGVDPTARVIVGGLTNPDGFLPAMLNARPGLRGHIDGVAIHPYGPAPRAVLANVARARRLLRALQLESVPLYVTEFGWTTRPPGALHYLPERLRPGYISLAIAALGHVDCGVADVLLYTWVTSRRETTNSEDWFGIQSPDGASSPDSDAFVAGLRAAAAPQAPIPLCSR